MSAGDSQLITHDSQLITQDSLAALQHYFGFDSFRTVQEDIVQRAVAGRDTLAIMPTGAGKSLCYQLAAMLRPTPTLVISPLIALMKDQVDNLPAEVGRHTSLINSSLPPEEASRRLRGLVAGDFKLIYAAPERLRQRNFIEALKHVEIGLLVVDEVHCVSMWGHDFRPDYLFIRSALEALGSPAVLGLTATATPNTARDIATSLGRQMDVVRTSVVRPNLRYDVEYLENEEEKLRATVALARRQSGSGIIYARSREKCEQVAKLLQRNGVNAAHYHAKLEPPQRAAVQEKFLNGSVRAIVATTAFGMGIDKPDVRWVLLYNFPSSLEDYVQRVGRAGRDGLPSICTLFSTESDAASLRRFAIGDLPTVDKLRNVYRVVRERSRSDMREISAEEVRSEAGLAEYDDPRVVVGMLERVELVRRDFDAGPHMRVDLLPAPPDTPQRIERLLKQYAEGAHERAQRMITFAAVSRCRHLQVAEHFGETVEVPCGKCDVCAPRHSVVPKSEEERALPDDIAKAIVEAMDELPWPLGISGLAATLKGSIDAPPSAQRSPGFGVLAGAKPGTIKRWIGGLIETGHIEQYEKDGGFRLLRVAWRTGLPHIVAGPDSRRTPGKRNRMLRESNGASSTPKSNIELSTADQKLFDQLREWRRDRARAAALPPYTIVQDKALREIAAQRPKHTDELAWINGIGPVKIERYGDEILALVATAAE